MSRALLWSSEVTFILSPLSLLLRALYLAGEEPASLLPLLYGSCDHLRMDMAIAQRQGLVFWAAWAPCSPSPSLMPAVG